MSDIRFIRSQGIQVVEFCQVAAGPFCGMLLADFGADVVKIEPPEGDALRQWPPITDGFSENFASLNRGKRSVVLDLKDPERDAGPRTGARGGCAGREQPPGRDAAAGPGLGLVRAAQALAGLLLDLGLRPGRPARRGGGLRPDDPGGRRRDERHRRARRRAGEGRRAAPDFTAGLYARLQHRRALARVRQGGPGGQLDVPMFATTLAIAALQTSEYFGTGRNPRKLGSAHPRNAPYQAYRARDGWFAVAAGNNKLWQQVCEVLSGCPTCSRTPRFATPTLRAANQVALRDCSRRTSCATTLRAGWRSSRPAGVPCAPINGYSEALADPQAAHLQLVQPMTLPGGTADPHRRPARCGSTGRWCRWTPARRRSANTPGTRSSPRRGR
jgi:crotonobetainyl-CoA:carnitine CoA-transferase CaiB-like acyl-CoA transferase